MIRKISKGLAKFVFVPLNVWLVLLFFGMRKFFLGFQNANKYLESVSKPCVIPILEKHGASIGKYCDLETGLIFHNCNDYSNLSVGDNCHIGKRCFFDLRGKVLIEENVVVSMQTTFITHQDINKSNLRILYPESYAHVTVKKNSYIGVNSTILKGVTIGEYSIIAAGSLVIDNVPSRVIFGGVPAKIIKSINGI